MTANHFKWRLVDWPLCQHSTVSRRKRVHTIIWLPIIPRRAARGRIWAINIACAIVYGLLIFLRCCASIEFGACHNAVATPLPVCVVFRQNLYPAVIVKPPDWYDIALWRVCKYHALQSTGAACIRGQIGGIVSL